jgi:hypothetical protein
MLFARKLCGQFAAAYSAAIFIALRPRQRASTGPSNSFVFKFLHLNGPNGSAPKSFVYNGLWPLCVTTRGVHPIPHFLGRYTSIGSGQKLSRRG